MQTKICYELFPGSQIELIVRAFGHVVGFFGAQSILLSSLISQVRSLTPSRIRYQPLIALGF